MFSKRDYITMAIICLILGFIVVRQFHLQKKITRLTQPEEGSAMALEVAELIKTNDKLRKEVEDLNEQYNKLSSSAKDQEAAIETVEKNLEKYQIILGQSRVEGPGVTIIFEDRLDSAQMIDLINALKNIGVEAIAVNHQRFRPRTSIEEGIFYPTTKVEAIGNRDLLEEALTRKGGIIEQIGTGKVQKQERLILPPA